MKKTWIAVVLNLFPFIFGLGYIYVGEWGRFLIVFGLQIFSLPIFVGFGLRQYNVFFLTVLWLFSLIDVYNRTILMNQEDISISSEAKSQTTSNISSRAVEFLKRTKTGDFSHFEAEGLSISQMNLTGGNFKHANFSRGKFANVNLSGANLHIAMFEGADLQNVILTRANLFATDFTRANLANANLQNAHLEAANFTGANLRGSDFQGANLFSCIWDGANLENANLRSAKLGYGGLYELRGAILKNTIMPDGIIFDPNKHIVDRLS